MSFPQDLAELRDGVIDFTTFAKRNKNRFERWARYFLERWPNRTLDLGDLVQEAMIEAWQAVDRWDPDRGTVTLVGFVFFRVGERLDRECKRVLGWPRRFRGQEAIKVDSFEAFTAVEGDVAEDSPIVRGAMMRYGLTGSSPEIAIDTERLKGSLSTTKTRAEVNEVVGRYLFDYDRAMGLFEVRDLEHARKLVRGRRGDVMVKRFESLV